MTIKVLYNNKKISGRVVYNFSAASDVVLVQFDGNGEVEIDKEILLYWDEYLKKWRAGQNIEKKHPEIFEQLMDILKPVFRDRLHFLGKQQSNFLNSRDN